MCRNTRNLFSSWATTSNDCSFTLYSECAERPQVYEYMVYRTVISECPSVCSNVSLNKSILKSYEDSPPDACIDCVSRVLSCTNCVVFLNFFAFSWPVEPFSLCRMVLWFIRVRQQIAHITCTLYIGSEWNQVSSTFIETPFHREKLFPIRQLTLPLQSQTNPRSKMSMFQPRFKKEESSKISVLSIFPNFPWCWTKKSFPQFC